MSTDDLDDRIRALVRDAVFAAPSAPELPKEAPAPAPDHRRWVWAGIAIAASLALLGAALAVGDDNGRTTPVGPTDLTSTVPDTAEQLPRPDWPAGATVVVASERGVERIGAENGEPVVTRVVDDGPVRIAFEVAEGVVVYQREDGSLGSTSASVQVPELPEFGLTQLEDAVMFDGELHLLYRMPSKSPQASLTLYLWTELGGSVPFFQPDGGWAVGYTRFSFVTRSQVGAYSASDEGTRAFVTIDIPLDATGCVELPEGCTVTRSDRFSDGIIAAGDANGSIGWMAADGHFVTTGAIDGQSYDIADPASVDGLDWRWNWLAVHRADGSADFVDLSTDTEYAMPVANGVATVSRVVPSGLPVASSVPTPDTGSVVPTSEPVQNNGFMVPCLEVGVSAVDVGVLLTPSQVALPLREGTPLDPIQIGGRDAGVGTDGDATAAVFGPPTWCDGSYLVAADGVTMVQFLAALGRVTVREAIPSSMPPVLVWGETGAAIVGPDGTTPVTHYPVDDAVMFHDGRVVFHSPDLADFQIWTPETHTAIPIWTAVDFAEQPELQDAYLDTFVFSVGTNLYRYDTGELVLEMGSEPIESVSAADDGAIAMFAEFGASDPTEPDTAVQVVDGAIQVVVRSTGVVLDWAIPNNATVVSLDIRGGWVTAGLELQPDRPGGAPRSEVRMIEVATGQSFRLGGREAHFG